MYCNIAMKQKDNLFCTDLFSFFLENLNELKKLKVLKNA